MKQRMVAAFLCAVQPQVGQSVGLWGDLQARQGNPKVGRR